MLAITGGLLLWLALPPVNWWPLAWLAPVVWTPLVTLPLGSSRRLYWKFWLAGYLFWSAAVYWITLPHWTAAIGWFFLAGYLGVYFPLFFGASRLAARRLGVPAELAMPIVWTALEFVRAYMFTGFLMAALGHTQYRWLELIQLSDLVGGYGVSFLVMFVGACVAQALPIAGRDRWRWGRLIPAAAALVAAFSYGHGRLGVARELGDGASAPASIALIQGTLDTQFGQTDDQFRETKRQTYEQYLRLSRQAVKEHPAVSLVVWPESMYRAPLITYHDLKQPPEDMPADAPEESRGWFYRTMRQVGVPMLLATNGWDYHPDGVRYYNTSVHIAFDPRTDEPIVAARYDKMHAVVFGEYMPFGDWFPWLYDLAPISGGLTAGEAPTSIEIEGGLGHEPLRAAPNICFETVLPHVIRRQVVELRERGEEPDLLITQTNDGWFWGSAALDMHLVCDVFRAVECRKSVLAAANTGISAWINDRGEIIEQLPRRREGFIVAAPKRSVLDSPYMRGGDWFAWTCAAATALFVVCGGSLAYRQRGAALPASVE